MFTDPQSFVQVYGDRFDRVGEPDGQFLGVPPGVSFAERSLPPGHLNRAVYGYTFDPRVLPASVTIEVAEVAPAFGRPGGGIQLLFKDGTREMTVLELIRLDVLK